MAHHTLDPDSPGSSLIRRLSTVKRTEDSLSAPGILSPGIARPSLVKELASLDPTRHRHGMAHYTLDSDSPAFSLIRRLSTIKRSEDSLAAAGILSPRIVRPSFVKGLATLDPPHHRHVMAHHARDPESPGFSLIRRLSTVKGGEDSLSALWILSPGIRPTVSCEGARHSGSHTPWACNSASHSEF